MKQKEIFEKLKREIEKRGMEIVRVERINDSLVLDFRDENIFRELERKYDPVTATQYSTCSCEIKKDGRIVCNIVSPVKKFIEFFIRCNGSSYRPHFNPEDRVVGIEVSTRNADEIVEILDSFHNAKGIYKGIGTEELRG